MNNETETYKLFQVSDSLIGKYEFNQIMIKEFQAFLDKEAWLYNPKGKDYQVIRITLFKASQFFQDKQRVEMYLEYFKIACKNENLKFLDIHISNDEYDENVEEFDYINIEENFYQGVKIEKIYPEILNCIKKSDNPKKEVTKYIKKIAGSIQSRKKNSPFLVKYPYICTLIVIGLCVLNFVIQQFLITKFDDTSALLLLGADYKTLTLGNNEFYRLFTYAFVHSGFAHIFCNLVSLYSLGKYIETRFGHIKFIIILFTSIIAGSLTQGILTDNQLCVGMSAGIYGLFTIFIIDVIRNRIINVRTLLPTLLLNLLLNFLSTVSWMSHLGGLICAIALYSAISNEKRDYKKYLLVVLLIGGLFIKYVLIKKIDTFYGGTDLAYIESLAKLGFDSQKLTSKILTIYEKFGGIK